MELKNDSLREQLKLVNQTALVKIILQVHSTVQVLKDCSLVNGNFIKSLYYIQISFVNKSNRIVKAFLLVSATIIFKKSSSNRKGSLTFQIRKN